MPKILSERLFFSFLFKMLFLRFADFILKQLDFI